MFNSELKNYFLNKITNIANYFHKKKTQSNLRTKLPNYNAGNNFKKYNTKNNLNCHIIICGISESLKNLLIFLIYNIKN